MVEPVKDCLQQSIILCSKFLQYFKWSFLTLFRSNITKQNVEKMCLLSKLVLYFELSYASTSASSPTLNNCAPI